MRAVVCMLLGLVAAEPAMAQAWLTVGDADGRFTFEMPVPFDLPPPQVAADGTITSAFVHETPELVLRFEVLDGLADHDEPLVTLISQARDGARIVQMHTHVVGRRTYRLVATFAPELEGDAVIRRFLESVRLSL